MPAAEHFVATEERFVGYLVAHGVFYFLVVAVVELVVLRSIALELRSYALVSVVNVNERFNRTVVEDKRSGGVGNNAHFAYGHVEQVGFGNNSARSGSVAAHGERFTRNRF